MDIDSGVEETASFEAGPNASEREGQPFLPTRPNQGARPQTANIHLLDRRSLLGMRFAAALIRAFVPNNDGHARRRVVSRDSLSLSSRRFEALAVRINSAGNVLLRLLRPLPPRRYPQRLLIELRGSNSVGNSTD